MLKNVLPFLLVSLLTFTHQNLLAQENEVTVTGNVVEGNTDQPVEFATVTINAAKDTSLVKGTITDASGKFTFAVKPGNYMLMVQFVSYKTIYQQIAVGENSIKNLGNLRIEENVEELKEVVITGQKTQMELALDKRIFNIGEDLANRAGNASEILNNLPSVSVDVDGNVSLRGSNSVKILINGRPSGLVGLSGGDALRLLNGNMIDKIELITNPSARYEAEGMAGIINIILKKEKKQGVNGAFSVEAGYPANHGASLNLNFRRNWVNIFTNYGLNYRTSPREGSSSQNFFLEDTTYSTNLIRNQTRRDLSHNFRLGTDFYLNEKTILTGSVLFRFGEGNNDSKVVYNDFDSNNQLFSRSERYSDETEVEDLIEYSINFTRTFDDPKHKLTFDVQYRNNDETEDDDLREFFTIDPENTPTLLQRSLNEEGENNQMYQLDYVKPIGEKGNFETGWRTTFRTIETDYLVEEQDQDENWQRVEEFSNDFVYTEDIHAIYAIYGQEFEKFSFQTGLRGEYTRIKTHLIDTDEINDNDYLNLFPSAHVTYKMKNENSLQASYSRRFQRPDFRSLNPFFSFSDNRNYRSGNPKLAPEFTDSYEFGYLKNWDKGNFYYGAYYRHTTGVISRINSVNEEGITFIRPENLNTENSFGFEGNFSRDVTKWLRFDGNVNFFRSIVEGEVNGESLSAETNTMSARFNGDVRLPKDYNFQMRGYYNAPRNIPQGKYKSFYSLDLAMSKDVLKKRGTIILNARNILNSMRFRSVTQGENFYYDSEYVFRPRQFSITFDYRINNNNKKQGGRKGGGGDFGGGGMDDF